VELLRQSPLDFWRCGINLLDAWKEPKPLHDFSSALDVGFKAWDVFTFAPYNLYMPSGKLSPRSVSTSRVSIAQLMEPAHANLLGNVHGGHIMKLVDEAGALACMKHSRQRVVTVVIDRMTFKHPIRIGDLITINAEVSYVGTTSMEAEVNVTAENPTTGEQWHTNTAYLVYVALNEKGKPIPVSPLLAENDFQRKRMEAGVARQKYRLSQSEIETAIKR
jgi:acyl-CoA hydrolase